ncbi:THO complex, subunitTHOC2, C-terminal,THO complex subunit 2, N-terminal domain,THO complex [Cinara cedri]|uniref:THO complex subunit 2 n=1 Tax=Cinara cedri TaxID=506608 RepID=A0A5E4N537_9HEMI|nr:THO complex, subunitTHOC2, C-terminal,THO complex subunit 2, N-terminal domain,THO complex [Cinara cedri]
MDKYENWGTTEKTEFLAKCHELVNSSKSEYSLTITNSGNPTDLAKAILSLLVACIKGKIKNNIGLSILSDLCSNVEIVSVVMDVFNYLDTETALTDAESEREQFGIFVRGSQKLLTDKLLKERLEIDSLKDIKLLNNIFSTKFIKIKTKLFYKQRKYNLFREESEGYSKLITELNSDNMDPKIMLEIIKSLIGCFNLDPNRVLDIILDSFEHHTDNKAHKFFIPLLRDYMPESQRLTEVLAFKLRQVNDLTRSSYRLIALLIQYNLIGLDSIYPWLNPDDNVIKTNWEKDMKSGQDYLRKASTIISKTPESESTEDKIEPKLEENQKFCLCEAMLEIGDWNTAQILIKRFPEYYAVEYAPIGDALCGLINQVIKPVYNQIFNLHSKSVKNSTDVQKNSLSLKPVLTLEEFHNVVLPMLITLGPGLHRDPVLMFKVVRIVRKALTNEGIKNKDYIPSETGFYYDTLSLLDRVLLPTLSLAEGSSISEHLWTLLQLYPYHCRYALYNSWKNDTHKYHPKLLTKRVDVLKKARSVMKRLCKDNTKPSSRVIGKISHYAPGYLFDYILGQIQVFDNLASIVVECLKYMTSLSFDVLGYCIVETLGKSGQDRVKHDGTSISVWLQSTASFCGAIFKKHPIELTGILQYVANQLKTENSLDLLILKEIVLRMAGVEVMEQITPDQIEAMSGGDYLKTEAGYYNQIRNTKKSSIRLKESLLDNNLAVALCLLIAQQRHSVIYKEHESIHIKLAGQLYDQCQDTLVQYGTFLGATFSMEEYINHLPSVHDLLDQHHVHMDVAFFLARPMFNHSINTRFDVLRKSDPNAKKSLPVRQTKYAEAHKEVMSSIVKSVVPLHPEKVWEDVSPGFLVTFWSLTLYDLCVPNEAYKREINKLKAQSAAIGDSKQASTKVKKEQERLGITIAKLNDEKKKQQEHVEKIFFMLNQEKDSWFLSRSAKAAKNETITQFLQLCLFPRCIFTHTDAMYCAKFVQTLHSLKTANFSTLLCYDRLFCDITYSVTLCTENEAHRYGIFLNEMLKNVTRWHSTQDIFEKECATYPGFVTKCKNSDQFVQSNNDHVGYENFRHVCHKWHYKITKAMMVCLESKDYVQIRNSLIILIKIVNHFPVLAKLASLIEKKVEKVREDEKDKRQDLYTLATSYCGLLKGRASQFLKDSDFHQVNEKVSQIKNNVDNKSGVTKNNQTIKKKEEDNIIEAKTPPPLPIIKAINGISSAEWVEAEKKVVDNKIKSDKRNMKILNSQSDKVNDKRDIVQENITELLKEDKYDEPNEKKREKRPRDDNIDREKDSYIELSKNHQSGKDVIISGSVVNHISKSQVPINITEKSNNTDVEVASNGSYTAAEKDIKRKKLDTSPVTKQPLKNNFDVKTEINGSTMLEKKDKKIKKSQLADSPTSKETRKDRKISRKRHERREDTTPELKRRKEDEKHTKTDIRHDEITIDKHRSSREKSPHPKEWSERTESRHKRYPL